MKKVEVTCVVCETTFMRSAAEVRRSEKLGRRIFCSRKCVGNVAPENLPTPKKGVVPAQLRGKAGNKRDKFSPFRQHLTNMRRRNKEVNVTLEDLLEIWERQGGRCPYTGWELDNPQTTVRGIPHHPRRASVDRVDPNRGYTKDNIQFVSLIAQYAKHTFTEDDLLSFAEAVVETQHN